ncbi:MAG: lysophospholipid acyltransferase family protein [Desulfobacteraceae bacterium]|jgi:1-acyl-sn-glycerol-3-phosphate acyltransferase
MKNTSNPKNLFNVCHTACVYTWTIFATTVLGILAIVVSFFSRNGDGVHHVARVWGKSILWVSGVRVETKGSVPNWQSRSYVYMSNHQSNFDIPVLLSALPVQFRWLAKAELFKIPIFGRSMRGAGYISIDRSNRKSAFKSLARAAAMIRNGTSVMIFPEGTRSSDGVLLPFKKGGFVLAVDAGVPIIPIVITGTHEIMPKGRMLICRRRVLIDVGNPIQASDYTRKTKDDLMARVHEAMSEVGTVAAEGGGCG